MGVRNTGWTWWNCHLRGSSIVMDTDHFIRLYLIFFKSGNHPLKGLFQPSTSGLPTVKSTSKRADTGMWKAKSQPQKLVIQTWRQTHVGKLIKKQVKHRQHRSKTHQCSKNSKGAATCDWWVRQELQPDPNSRTPLLEAERGSVRALSEQVWTNSGTEEWEGAGGIFIWGRINTGSVLALTQAIAFVHSRQVSSLAHWVVSSNLHLHYW